MPMRGWGGDRQQYEDARRAGLRRYWASSRSQERRRKQSEWAKTLNRTMPQEMRRANDKKVSAARKKMFKDPAKKREFLDTVAKSGHINTMKDPVAKAKMLEGVRQRRKKLDTTRAMMLEKYGVYVEDNTSMQDLDDIIAIFL